MKPNDDFFYYKGQGIVYDNHSMVQLYQPIIGMGATALYGYFVAFWDNGSEGHKFSEVLNHLQIGQSQFEEALALLTAMDLVQLYQESKGFLIILKQPLSKTEFLAHPAYRHLLEKKIGDFSVRQLEYRLPDKSRDLTKKFSEVFSEIGELSTTSKWEQTFDLENFKKRMLQDGLKFLQEKDDVIALYHMAERYQMTWFQVYELAKETAYKATLQVKRMKAKKDLLDGSRQDTAFSEQEMILLRKAKADRPDVMLAQIKKGRQASVTADELKALDELVEMGFLDEIINLMVIYTMAKTHSANLNKKYLMKIANDFAYQNVSSAESAIEKMRSFDQRKESVKQTNKTVSNVPKWSQENYKNETTKDEQLRLDEIKRQTLAKLGKGQ